MSCKVTVAVLLKIHIWRNVTPCRLENSYYAFKAEKHLSVGTTKLPESFNLQMKL